MTIMTKKIITRQCLLKILFLAIIVFVICSCSQNIDLYNSNKENVVTQTPNTNVFRGQYYYKEGSESVEYFDDITHDLRQLKYTYKVEDFNIYTDNFEDLRFVWVYDYDSLIATLDELINSKAYEIEVNFPVDTEGKTSWEKAVQIADYYFNVCNISHEKEIVISLRQNQRKFNLDKISSNLFIGYFDNNYKTLEVAAVLNEKVLYFETYDKVEII